MSETNDNKVRLIEITALCKRYCELCEEAGEYTKIELTERALDLLPRIYWNFFDLESSMISLEENEFLSTYVDEEIYESIRSRIAVVMGANDIYLDTFEEDMKYSETPISASISEGMADIFQPLFNFVSIVRDSEGELLEDAFLQCKEDFITYWSQTLCNIMKALNNIKYNNTLNEDDL